MIGKCGPAGQNRRFVLTISCPSEAQGGLA